MGILYKGDRPTLDAKTETSILTGKKGLGGQSAGGNAGVDGADGKELKLN